MATNLSNLVLIVVDGVQIPVEQGDLNQGIQMAMESGSHSVFPTTNYVQQKAPVATFSTKAIDVALDAVGINCLGLDSTSTFDMYFADKLFQGTGTGNRRFYSNTGATKITINSGFVLFDSLSAPAGGGATASFRVLAAGETDAVGLVITPNSSVPDVTSGCLDYAFVVGPMKDSTGAEYPLTSWTYNSGIQEEYNYRNGLPTPAGVAINAYEPNFTIESNDKDLLDEFVSNDEIIGCLTDVTLFLRKTDLCQSRVPEATAEHIGFTIPSATIFNTSASGGFRQSASYGFELRPVLECGGSDPIIAIDTTIAISPA